MFRPACLLLLAASVFAPLAAPGQEGGEVVFRSDVSLVRVDAQVLDREHRAVTGLTADDFILKEEGQVQPIRNFASEDMPVDIVLLLDVSGSMRTHVERIAAAAHTALQVLREQDRVAIMVFDRTSRLRLPFKSSQEDVEAGLEAVLRQEDFNGGTDITRGLLDATNYVRREARRDARRAIVILTDDQTERERDEDKVSRALVSADAVLSALLAPDAMRNRYPGSGGGGGGWPRAPRSGGPWGGTLGDIILGRRGPAGGGGPVVIGPRTHSAGTAEIAQRSGGDSIPVDAASSLETTLERIRHRYALHFHLPEGTQPGQERGIEVQLASNALRRYPGAEVRYRRVYLTPNGLDEAPPPSPVLVSRAPDNPAPEPLPEASGSPPPRRRGVDRPSGPRGPMMEPGQPFPDANRPQPPAETPCGGWRRVDEPERPSCADAPAKPAATPAPEGGWREVKPGEKP